jgi:hypothetical protein
MPDSTPHPTFANPPVIETRLGVQFAPLHGFWAGHFGLFWRECLGEGWHPRPDGEFQPHRAERFGTPELAPVSNLGEIEATPVRMALASADGRKLVQFQPDQLAMSFSRGKPGCPTYHQVRDEFGRLVGKAVEFTARHGLPPLAPDLWDVAYVNVVPSGAGELWQTPADWHRVFPRLFPTGVGQVGGCEFGTFDATWYFNLPDQRGRVHVKASKAVARKPTAYGGTTNPGPQPVLLVVLTVRGEVKDGASWEAELDYGHAAAAQVFYDLSSAEARSFWGHEP